MSDTVAKPSPGVSPTASAPSAARSTLGIFGTRLVTFPLTVVTGILVTRILGPTDKGIYAYLLLAGSFVLPLMSFGFGASIVYFISSGRYKTADVFLTCLAMGLVQGMANAIVLGGLWYVDCLGATGSLIPATLLLPMLLVLPLQGALLMLTRVLLGDSWFWLNNLVTLATPLVTSLLLLALVVFAGWGLNGAVATVVATNFAMVALVLVAGVRKYRPTVALHRGFVADSYRYGLRAWVGDLAVRANLRMDQPILGAGAPPAELGIYSTAVAVSELLWMVPDSLAFVLFNKIAAEKDERRRIELTERVHRALFLVMVLLGVALAATGPWLIRLMYGAAFIDASWPLVLLMPGTVALTTSRVVTKYFAGSGMPGRSSMIYSVGAIASAALYFLLIPRYGNSGAAIASSVGYVVIAATAALFFRAAIRPVRMHLFRMGLSDLVWAIEQVRSVVKWPRARPSGVPRP